MISNESIEQILEKIRPLDLKLRYQVDKLIKLATTGNGNVSLINCINIFCVVSAGSNPLHFRPNPDNLISKVCKSTEVYETI